MCSCDIKCCVVRSLRHLYRPRSATLCATFFDELADVLDRLATFVEPLFIVGDLNVHLERSSDQSATQLVVLLADYGLSCRVNEPTHNLGGLLDVVASRDDLQPPSVDGEWRMVQHGTILHVLGKMWCHWVDGQKNHF